MKTLDEWLASSSSDDEQDEVSATVSPSTLARTSANLVGKAQEDAETTLPGGVSHPAQAERSAAAAVATATAALAGSAANVANEVVASSTQSPPAAAPDSAGYVREETYVVDRGTQTVCTAATQTDPLPQENAVGEYLLRSFGITQAPDYVANSQTRGIDGRPYRQVFDDYEQRNAQRASELREQLDLLQNSVDMLIARYNLPPPPSLP